MTRTLFVFVMGAAVIVSAQIAEPVQSETPEEAEAAIRNVLKLAGSDSREQESEYAREIVARGKEAVPILQRLFHENTDGFYRAVILQSWFKIENGREEAFDFLQREIVRGPEGWGGKGSNTWIMVSLNYIPQLEVSERRVLALNVIERAEDSVLIRSMLGLLAKIGQTEDLPVLEERLRLWRDEDPSKDFTSGERGAVIRAAERAIATLSGEEQESRSRSVQTGTSPRKNLQAPSKTAPVPDTSADSSPLPSSIWIALIAGAVLVTIIWVVKRR